MLLNESEISKEWFNDCHSLHFCSVDLIDCPMKEAHKKAILEFLPLAHIVKISDEELEFITGFYLNY